MGPKIETGRLLIRQFRHEDKQPFISLMINKAITDNLAFDDSMKTEDGALIVFYKTIESYGTTSPLLAFAIEHKPDHKFIGVCGLSPVIDNHSVEIFYAFLPEYWGKGFATETLIGLKNYIATGKQVNEIHAYIRPSNVASMKVAEKAGFVREKLVDKEYFDEKVYDYTFSNTR